MEAEDPTPIASNAIVFTEPTPLDVSVSLFANTLLVPDVPELV